MLAPSLLCSLPFAIADRLWGWSQGQRFVGLVVLAGSTGIFAASQGLLNWQIFAVAGATFIGMFGGRLTDGVRGTFSQKGLRGLLYAGIPIGFALVTWSWIPLLTILPFAVLNGFIAWACSKLFPADQTLIAEPLTGLVLGLLNLSALGVAIQLGAHTSLYPLTMPTL